VIVKQVQIKQMLPLRRSEMFRFHKLNRSSCFGLKYVRDSYPGEEYEVGWSRLDLQTIVAEILTHPLRAYSFVKLEFSFFSKSFMSEQLQSAKRNLDHFVPFIVL
jgi:hypothetical protein